MAKRLQTLENMARLIFELRIEDERELAGWSAASDAAFEGYAGGYLKPARRGKGFHGG